VKRPFGTAAFLGLLALLLPTVWLWLSPPDLVRVGTGFAAKTVCSQVFIAGRDAAAVLRDDVQAPGHPLLRAVRVTMDEEARTVTASLLGLWASARAAHHETLGCALIHGEDQRPVVQARREAIPAPALEGAIDGRIQEMLEDPSLVGPGFRAGVILHKGRVIAEHYAPGFGPETPLYGWSMTKTVTAVLVGTLIQQGRLSLDEQDLVPIWTQDERAQITLAHLLGMESGLAWDEAYGAVSDVNRMLFLSGDMAHTAMASPAVATPGTEFRYASGSSVLLSWIWQHRLGDPELASTWPRSVLFEPLGMSSAVLEADASGTFAGSSFMMATARDWGRFGWFLAEGGRVGDRRVLPEGFVAWMRESTRSSDGVYGRGQLWRRGPGRLADEGWDLPDDLFWLLGHDGQSISVSPENELVIVRLGLTPERLGFWPEPLVSAVMERMRKLDE
jgi:CubicO group peptidase (beta-lactamase class C family)